MGRSADEISREIADTRGDMERKIVALRERGQRTMRQGVRVAIVAGALAGAAVAAFVIYRVRRPPTWQQRVIRTVPKGWRGRLQGLYDQGELTLRRGLPPMRLYVNDKQVGQEPPSGTLEKLVIRAAQTAGTAAAAALASKLFENVSGRGKTTH